MLLDKDHNLAVIYGISEDCAGNIAEEISRTGNPTEGKKPNGWIKRYGKLTVIEGDDEKILVISGMSDETVEAYGKLEYV